MIANESKMREGGWRKDSKGSWQAPAAPRAVVQESRAQLLESAAAAYRALGLTEAESRIAAGIESRSISEGQRFLIEQGTPGMAAPIDALGTLSKEFQATQRVLEGAGYSCTSVVANTSTACFTKADCRDILLSMDGSWQFANAKDDSVRGLTDPLTRAGNDSVMNGRNANSLKLAFLTGLK